MAQREKTPGERGRVARSDRERRKAGVRGRERGGQAVVREMEGGTAGRVQGEEGGKALGEEGAGIRGWKEGH